MVAVMLLVRESPPVLRMEIHNHSETMQNGCRVWLEDKDKFGTPTMRVQGAFIAVLKVVWWLKHGYKPLWKHMVQACSTRGCLNPDHYTDNTPAKDRKPKLVNLSHWNTPTFTPEEDAELWEENLRGKSMAQLAKENRTNPMTICRAIRRHWEKPVNSPLIAKLWERWIIGDSIAVLAYRHKLKFHALRKALELYDKQIQDS